MYFMEVRSQIVRRPAPGWTLSGRGRCCSTLDISSQSTPGARGLRLRARGGYTCSGLRVQLCARSTRRI